MRNKKFLLTTAAVVMGVTLSTGLLAHSGKHMDRMAEKLGLDEQQQQQVKTIFTEQKDKAKQQRQALRAETNEKLSQVLTAEQYQQLMAIQEKRRDKYESKRRHHKWHD